MLSEKQLINNYKKAVQMAGNTPQHLAEMLECRLDNVVYKLKFASTIFGAQQLVNHGHILVDGKKVDIRSFQVKPGMIVSIKEKSQKMKSIQESLASQRDVPTYLTLDANKFSGQLMTMPGLDQISWPLEIKIIEICDFLEHTT